MSNPANSTPNNGPREPSQANNTTSNPGTSTQANQGQRLSDPVDNAVRYKPGPDGGPPNFCMVPGTYRNISTNKEYIVGPPPRVDGKDGYPPGYIPTWGLVPGTYVNVKDGRKNTVTAAAIAALQFPQTAGNPAASIDEPD